MLRADRLFELRKKKGVYQKDVANALGLERTTYVKYESSGIQPPNDMMVKLADYFGVATDYLLGKSNTPNYPKENKKALRIDVYGSIPAGIPVEAVEDIIDWEEVPIEWTNGGREYFGLKIKGDSMSPKYLDGDVVLFEKMRTCDSGADCAVIVNGNEATFKRVIRQSAGVTLQPLNTAYEPVFYSNQEIDGLPVTVIGIARELRRKI